MGLPDLREPILVNSRYTNADIDPSTPCPWDDGLVEPGKSNNEFDVVIGGQTFRRVVPTAKCNGCGAVNLPGEATLDANFRIIKTARSVGIPNSEIRPFLKRVKEDRNRLRVSSGPSLLRARANNY